MAQSGIIALQELCWEPNLGRARMPALTLAASICDHAFMHSYSDALASNALAYCTCGKQTGVGDLHPGERHLTRSSIAHMLTAHRCDVSGAQHLHCLCGREICEAHVCRLWHIKGYIDVDRLHLGICRCQPDVKVLPCMTSSSRHTCWQSLWS